MTIRRATLHDLDTIEGLMKDFMTTHHPTGTYESDHFSAFLSEHIDGENCLVLLMNDDEGLFIGFVTTPLWSSEPIAEELVWFTLENARGHGLPMLRRFHRWAEKRGAVEVHCSIREPSKAMERLGFHITNVNYAKRLVAPGLKPAVAEQISV